MKSCNEKYFLTTFILLATSYSIAKAENFGGPDAVDNLIVDDMVGKKAFVKKRFLESWFDWKKSLQEKSGLSFGLDYTALYLDAENSPGKSSASSGMLRFFGSWDLIARGTKNTGALVWKVENRHAYGDVAPSSLGLGELGYAGMIGASLQRSEITLD